MKSREHKRTMSRGDRAGSGKRTFPDCRSLGIGDNGATQIRLDQPARNSIAPTVTASSLSFFPFYPRRIRRRLRSRKPSIARGTKEILAGSVDATGELARGGRRISIRRRSWVRKPLEFIPAADPMSRVGES